MLNVARQIHNTEASSADIQALQNTVHMLQEQLQQQSHTTYRLTLQYQIAEVLSHAKSIESGIKEVLTALIDKESWDLGYAWISVHSPLDTQLGAARHDIDADTMHSIAHALTPNRPDQITRKSYESQRLHWYNSLQHPAGDPLKTSLNIHSAVAFPLTAGHASYGVIVLVRQDHYDSGFDAHTMYLSLGRSIGHFVQARRYHSELRSSTKRLSQVQQIAKIGYWELNPHTKTMRCNHGAAHAIGRSHLLLPRTLNEYLALLNTEDQAIAKAAFEQVALPPYPAQHFEHGLKDENGCARILEVRCKAELDNQHRLIRISGSVQNVTEQRTIQVQLATSEKLWELVFRHSPVPGALSDRHTGELLAVNDQFCQWLQKSKEDLIGQSTIDLGFWATSQQRETLIQLAQESGRIQNYECQHWINGTLRNVLICLEIFELHGKLCLFTQYVDITERKELENSIALRAAAIEQAADAMLLLNSTGVIRSVNPAFTKLTGYLPDEAVGHPMDNLLNLPSGRYEAGLFQWLTTQLDPHGHWKGELWAIHKNGNLFCQSLSISAVRHTSTKATNFVVVFSDTTERKRYESELLHQALHDKLTGLPNRVLLQEHLSNALKRAHRQQLKVAVFFVDLDHFKQINDEFGHETGDQLLQHIARHMQGSVRESDLVARIGGDEFVVVLEGLSCVSDAQIIASKLIQAVSRPIIINQTTLRVGMSIGISMWPDHTEDADALIRQADEALYQSKSKGRNCHVVWQAPETPGTR